MNPRRNPSVVAIPRKMFILMIMTFFVPADLEEESREEDGAEEHPAAREQIYDEGKKEYWL